MELAKQSTTTQHRNVERFGTLIWHNSTRSPRDPDWPLLSELLLQNYVHLLAEKPVSLHAARAFPQLDDHLARKESFVPDSRQPLVLASYPDTAQRR
jgi:hypothetical protein